MTLGSAPASQGSTPHQDGFYLPGDAARLGRVWLAWPQDPALQACIITLARTIDEFTAVSVIAAPAAEKAARDALGSQVEIVCLPHLSARVRDTGPTFLVDGKGGAAAVDWRFSAWGARAALAPEDETFAHTLLGHTEVRRFRAPLTLESSAFTGDGQDTLLALAPAVFDPNRNPELSRLAAFAIFQQWLGVSRVVWVEQVHPRDSLVSDIRAVATFAGPGRVLVNRAEADHPFAAPLAAAARDLARVRDAQGNLFEIIAMPTPATPSPLSYTGFLPVNGAILMPACGAASDEAARGLLAELFPQHHVRLIPAEGLAVAGIPLASLVVPHPARLLERDRASILPRSAWSQPPPDVDAILQKYIDLAARE